ncbi:MAG: hypothetical protein ACRDCG_02420 [Mycoplasmoidaceae bacterium]
MKKSFSDSIDYENRKDKNDFNINSFFDYFKLKWKIISILLGFFFLFIIGLILTITGAIHYTKDEATDYGNVDMNATLLSGGLIFILLSSFSLIIIIPIIFRAIVKIREKKKSSKILLNK